MKDENKKCEGSKCNSLAVKGGRYCWHSHTGSEDSGGMCMVATCHSTEFAAASCLCPSHAYVYYHWSREVTASGSDRSGLITWLARGCPVPSDHGKEEDDEEDDDENEDENEQEGTVWPTNGDALDAATLLRQMLRCAHLGDCKCLDLRPICEAIYDGEGVSEEDYAAFEIVRPR